MRIALTCALACAALVARAVDPSLLMHTQTDPSRMMQRPMRFQASSTAFVGVGGVEAYTHVVWFRFPYNPQPAQNLFTTLWSVDAARATREGGATLPALIEYQTVNDNWGTTFANPHYACPETLQNQWQYGCYCVNIETPVDVTVTVAGAERFVAASNGVKQIFNILGVAADYSVSVTGATGGNTPVKFGLAANPLVQFYGLVAQSANELFATSAQGGQIQMYGMTNEWAMCVSRVRIEGGNAIERLSVFTWTTETFSPGETSNAVSRASFAPDARHSINLMTFGTDVENTVVDQYGQKIFGRWLTDDELRNVRDVDMFEMQRRGIQRWRWD